MNKTHESQGNHRVVIYGAGAIGGVVGSHLALGGTEVILIGRSGHVNAINEHGLRLVTPTDTHILHLSAVTSPDQIDFRPNDLVFLCVKSQDTDEALRDLRTVVKDVPIFCFQNGVRNEEIAIKYFSVVYGVMIRDIGGVYITDGEVMARRDPPGALVMGRYPVGTDNLLESVAANLRKAEFYVLVTSDVIPYKWGKLIRNLHNTVDAITNAAEVEITRITNAAQEEAQDVLALAGIRWISDSELALQWPQFSIPPRCRLSIEAKGSGWQSLARRRGTVEADFFNGEIVRLANRLGKQAPVNEMLLRTIQQMADNHESPGKYSPTELLRMLGLN
ncbi:ketopantoate reductase family protein [Chloroflexota bacterium]